MRAPEDTSLLLDLLREAGDQAVTLDELEVVGVRDPASALLDLELSGHAISRVLDDRTECVRLAPFNGVHLLAEPGPEPAAAGDPDPVAGPEPAAAAAAAPAPRGSGRLLVAALLLLLGLLLASRR